MKLSLEPWADATMRRRHVRSDTGQIGPHDTFFEGRECNEETKGFGPNVGLARINRMRR
jgi:hypothetical protein